MPHMRWVLMNDKICIKIVVTLVLLTQVVSYIPNTRPTREYLKMRIEERIKHNGYPCDQHEIVTSDGYILHLYRIPYGTNPTKNFECDGDYVNVKLNGDDVEEDFDNEYSEGEGYSAGDEEYYEETTEVIEDAELATTTESAPTIVSTTSSTTTTPESDTHKIYSSTAGTTVSTISYLLKNLSTTTASNVPTTHSTSKTTSTTISSNTTSLPLTTTEPSTSSTSKPTEPSTRRTHILKIPKKPWRKPKRSNRRPEEFKQNLVNDEKQTGKSVILLMHGMTGGPTNFIHNGRDGLAFYFADRGFDVWILCFRGTNCGQKKFHVKHDRDRDGEYWDFTFHHMASIDVPTAIDYILPITNQSGVHIIGHSAGTIIQIIFLSERPEYAAKTKIGAQYGGSVFIGRSDYPFLQFSSSISNFLNGLHKFFGWNKALPVLDWNMFMGFLVEACYSDEFFHICEATNSMVGSHKSVLVDKYASIPILFHDSQMEISFREVIHFMNMMASGECMKYDYGKKRNLREYGQETPPFYNFSRVTNPLILHYSENDHFGNLADLKRGVSLLPNVVQVYHVPFWRFTHTDYVLGRNASKLVYENSCKMFKRYDRGERFEPLTKVDIDEPLFY